MTHPPLQLGIKEYRICFLKRSCKKNNVVFRNKSPASIHFQRFTGHICDWSILNDWAIQKIDLITSTWRLCNIATYLTHKFPTCKRVQFTVKVRFSVLIYQTLEAFMQVMKYTLFEVNLTRLKFLNRFLFLKM